MGLIIKNNLSFEEYQFLQGLREEIEESSPYQSYIRIVYSHPHQLDIKITSQSLSWEISHMAESFEDLVEGARILFRARIQKWHIERNLS